MEAVAKTLETCTDGARLSLALFLLSTKANQATLSTQDPEIIAHTDALTSCSHHIVGALGKSLAP